MKLTRLSIPEVIVIEPEVFEDERGFFFEAFNQKKFNHSLGGNITFVQDNHSKSKQGVLRGLHYQKEPYGQSKLINVVYGEIFDVAVDIRKNSPTYGKWVSMILSSNNKKQLFIPSGFAHGFLVTSDFAIVKYKVTNYYHPDFEETLLWDDPSVGVKWPINSHPILSAKDTLGKSLNNL